MPVPVSIGTFILIGIGVLFYRYFKGKAGGAMGGNPLDQMLGTKKFEPIKPENIKTYFKDVAGMHEAKS